jgi:hypothetical protein
MSVTLVLLSLTFCVQFYYTFQNSHSPDYLDSFYIVSFRFFCVSFFSYTPADNYQVYVTFYSIEYLLDSFKPFDNHDAIQ